MTRTYLADAKTSRIMIGHGRKALQGNATLFPSAIPLDAVTSDLFGWTADTQPLFTSRNGVLSPVESHVANVRSDTGHVLGIVGEGRATHQFAEVLGHNVAQIIGSGLSIDSAGWNRNGAVGWVSVSGTELLNVEGVQFLPRILAYSSHDASLVTNYSTSVLNPVCNNAMGQMVRESNSQDVKKHRIRHSRNSLVVIRNVQHALGLLDDVATEYAAQVTELLNTSVTDAEWEAILDDIAPLASKDASARANTLAENKRNAIDALYLNDPRCAPWSGTAYGVVQTVNTYGHHVQTVRGAHRDDRNLMATLNGDWDALDNRTAATVRRVLQTR